MPSRKALTVVSGLFTLLLPAAAAFADARRIGAEKAVSQSAIRQRDPNLSLRQDGGGWVVWENLNQGIVARRLSISGEPLGAEVLLVANRNLDTIPAQGQVVWHKEPAIAALADGGFLLAWTRERLNLSVDIFWENRELIDRIVFTQAFDAAGSPLGRPFRVQPGAATLQSSPRLALARNWAGVAWLEAASPASGKDTAELHGRFLDLSGRHASDEFQIADAGAAHPALAVSGPNLWVAWEALDGSGDGVFVRRFHRASGSLGPAARVNETVAGCQRRAAFAERADGGFWVFFHGPTANENESLIYARRLSAAGQPLAADLAISPGDYEDEVYPAAAALGDGRYVVMWMSWWKNFPQGFYGLELRDDGGLEPVGEAVRLNEFRAYTQFRTASSSASGRVTAVWESLAPRQKKAGVSVQTFSAD